MLATLSHVSRTASVSITAKHSFSAFYSTVSGLTRRNWGTSGPTPQSLINSDEPRYERGTDPNFPTRDQSASRRKSKAKAAGPTAPQHRAHRVAMKEAFPEGWSPPRKLSRDAMDGLRSLHAYDPETFTTPVLAQKFRISPEAVRRILKSKWEPTKEQRARFLEKERKERDEYIQQRRMEELQEQMELDKTRRRFVGRDSKDKLSLT